MAEQKDASLFDNELPPQLRQLARDTGHKPLICKVCQQLASSFELCVEPLFDDDECFFISCSGDCKSKAWAYCKTCQKTFSRSTATKHAKSKKHQQNKEQSTATMGQKKKARIEGEAMLDHVPPRDDVGDQSMDDVVPFSDVASVSESLGDMSTNAFFNSMDAELHQAATDCPLIVQKNDEEEREREF